MSKKNQLFKSAFKQTTKVSFIQNIGIQKKQKLIEDNKIQQNQIQKQIQQNVDENTIKLDRTNTVHSDYVLFRKTGQLFISKKQSGLFACFTPKRKSYIVQIINRKIYIKNNNNKLIGFINFDAVTCQYKQDSQSIRILIKNRIKGEKQLEQFYFQGLPNTMQISVWQQIIKQVMKQSQGLKHKLNYITTLDKYWQSQYILQSQFTSICRSGDILLFKSGHIGATFQRAGTGSEYDHVGILLKNTKNQIVIFQSTSTSGVAFTFWKDLMRFKWYQNVIKLAYRKLNLQRDQRMISMMEQFIVKNLDKKFHLDLGKIFTFRSILEKSVQDQQNRTYFCSQLVAAFYKHIGLLQRQKSSTQYWPVDFSEAKQLPLLKGNLCSQQVICFQKQIYGDKYEI